MKLSSYLEAHGISAKQFAERCGVEPSTITRFVRGERRPRIDVLQRIVEETGGAVTANDFLPPTQPEAKEQAA